MGAFGSVVIPGGGATSGGVTLNADGTKTQKADDGSIVTTNQDGTTSRSWTDAKGQTIREVTANDPNGNPVTFQEIIDENGNRRPNMDDPATAKAFGPDLAAHLSDPGNHLTRKIGNAAATVATSLIGLGGVTNKALTDPNAKATITSGGAETGTGGGAGTGTPAGAAKNLTDLQAGLAAAAANGGPNTAPTMTAATYTAPTISAPTPVSHTGYTAPTISAPPTISAGNIANVPTVTPTTISAGSVSAPVIGQPGTIKAGSVTAPQIAVGDISKPADVTAQHIDRIMMDPTQTTESRDAMLKALAMAEGAANGTAPSAAVQLLQKAIDTNARQQLGAAGTLQGRSPGAALRAGQQGLMAANAASSADMAALRASEQATGRQQYGTFASSLYQTDASRAAAQLGADVDVAKTNASLLLDAAKSNQSAALNTSIANLNKQVTVATANMQAALDAGKFNVAQQMQAQIENIHNTIAVATSNATNELQARISTLSAQMDAAKANQATALAAGQTNASNALTAQIAKMQSDLEASKANLAAVTQTNISNATLAANASQFNANAANQASLADLAAQTQVGISNASLAASAGQFNAGSQNTAAQTNVNAALQQQIIDNARAQGLRDDQIKILLAQMGFGYQDKALAQTQKLADDAAFASGLSTFGKLVSAKGSSGSGGGNTSDGGVTYGTNGVPILD